MNKYRTGFWVRFFAWLRGGEVVVLEDLCGVEYVTIATRSPFGKLVCHVYWGAKVGHCVLLEDGKVDPKSDASYIERWMRV